jgi:hypothetical protein
MLRVDPRGKEEVANDHNEKEKIPIDDEPEGEKFISSGTKKEGKKKCIKKIVYCKCDTSTSSTSLHKDSSFSKEKTVKSTFNHTPFNYSHISRNSNAQLLFIPLANLLTFMRRIILGGAINCVIIFFRSILAFGTL